MSLFRLIINLIILIKTDIALADIIPYQSVAYNYFDYYVYVKSDACITLCPVALTPFSLANTIVVRSQSTLNGVSRAQCLEGCGAYRDQMGSCPMYSYFEDSGTCVVYNLYHMELSVCGWMRQL